MAEVDLQEAEMKAAWASGDVDRMLEFYSDDAVYCTNNKDIVKGKDQFRGTLADLMAKYPAIDVKTVHRKTCDNGNSMVEMGTFQCKTQDGGSDNGKYMCCFERKGDKWVCCYDFSMFE